MNYTCGAGTTLLVVSVIARRSSGAATRSGGAPTYNSVALQQVDSQRVATAEVLCELWYMVDPPTGSSLVLSLPNSTTSTVTMIASSYKAQSGYTSALDTTAVSGGTGSGANPSQAVTTTVNGAVIVDGMGHGLSTAATGRSQTAIQTVDEGQWNCAAQDALQANFGSITFSYTIAADNWAKITAGFKEIVRPVSISSVNMGISNPSAGRF